MLIKKYFYNLILPLITCNLLSAEVYDIQAELSRFSKIVETPLPLSPAKHAFPLGFYPYNPNVALDEWNQLAPYFLPIDHPIKEKLDRLFNKLRVTKDTSSLKKAGFETPRPRKFSHCVVSKNKKIKKYYFKLFTDDQSFGECKQFLDRLHGAQELRYLIAANGWEDWFAVPQKWIYPIPSTHHESGQYPKHFILIAEDMRLVDGRKNRAKWKGSSITEEKLQALFILLTQAGLCDCVYSFNLPFNKKGKISFIDLEHIHQWPIPYHKLIQYLSPSMQEVWKKMIAP